MLSNEIFKDSSLSRVTNCLKVTGAVVNWSIILILRDTIVSVERVPPLTKSPCNNTFVGSLLKNIDEILHS